MIFRINESRGVIRLWWRRGIFKSSSPALAKSVFRKEGCPSSTHKVRTPTKIISPRGSREFSSICRKINKMFHFEDDPFALVDRICDTKYTEEIMGVKGKDDGSYTVSLEEYSPVDLDKYTNDSLYRTTIPLPVEFWKPRNKLTRPEMWSEWLNGGMKGHWWQVVPLLTGERFTPLTSWQWSAKIAKRGSKSLLSSFFYTCPILILSVVIVR